MGFRLIEPAVMRNIALAGDDVRDATDIGSEEDMDVPPPLSPQHAQVALTIYVSDPFFCFVLQITTRAAPVALTYLGIVQYNLPWIRYYALCCYLVLLTYLFRDVYLMSRDGLPDD